MGKARELLGIIASITEEGEAGPLNLAVGAKVKFMKDEQEVVGEICADDSGACYDQAADAYCVKVGDEMMMVKSSELTVGESKKPATPAKPAAKKPNPFKKTRNEDALPDEETPAAAALAAMDGHTATIKEACAKMREMVDPDGQPNTSAMIEAMDAECDMMKQTYEGELNNNPDGGGAGDGGTEIPTPAQ